MATDYLVPWINASGQGGLRNSMITAPGDGVTKTFSFNFAGGYIRKSDIKAYTYDNASGATAALALTTDMWTGANHITLPAAIPVNTFLVIYRDTQKTVPLVNFTNGAVLNEPNLDEMANQSIFVTAEMADRFDAVNASSADAIARSFTALTASQKATADSAAATSTANSALSASGTAVSTANAATGTANSANTTALGAKATAEGIDGKAQTALDQSTAAVATANGIDSKASTALSQSTAAVSAAGKASSDASAAVTTANSVSTKADNAVATANAAATTVANAVPKAGGTMTGDLFLRASAQYSPWLHFFADGYLGAHMRVSASALEFYNSDYTIRNMAIDNAGNVSVSGGINAGGRITGGDLLSTGNVYCGNGASFLQTNGDINGSVWGGYLSTWASNLIENRASAWAATRQPVRNSGWQNGGYVVTNSSNSMQIWWDGNVEVQVDGSYQGYMWTSGNFNPGTKANAGSQCQIAAYSDFGGINARGTQRANVPAPWVMVGAVVSSINGPSGDCIGGFNLIGAWLVNQ